MVCCYMFALQLFICTSKSCCLRSAEGEVWGGAGEVCGEGQGGVGEQMAAGELPGTGGQVPLHSGANMEENCGVL